MARVTTVLLAAAVWGAGWFAPWPAGLARVPWLTVGLAGIIMIAPGACAARLLGRRGGALRDLTAGFAVSVAALGGLGLLGCLLGSSTAMPGRAFGALGMAVVGIWAWRRPMGLPQPRRRLVDLAVLVPLLVAMAAAACVAALPDAGGDNFMYNAMIADFARGDRLGFEDPIFPGRPKISRLWLSYWQLVLAVLSQRTGIDVLPLSSVYVAPFLAILAVAAVAELARRLGLSRRWAALAASAQVAALLCLTAQHQPGWAFFTRLREDKLATAFVLVPVWLAVAADALRRPSRGRAALTALVGAGVMLSHPTVFAIALLILALYAALDALATRRLRPALSVLVPAGALSLGLVGVRIAGDLGGAPAHVMHHSVAAAVRAGDTYLLRAPRLEIADDGEWYRVRAALLGPLPLAAMIGCAVVALTRVGSAAAARYVVTAVAVTGAVLIAPTARLLGFAVTPFHLWRFLWLMPFGIAVATAASVAADALRSRGAGWLRQPAGLVAGAQVAVLLAATLSPRGSPKFFPRPPDWETRAYWYFSRLHSCAPTFDELARLGAAIDARGGGVTVGAPAINDFIPGVSVRAAPLTFSSPRMLYELRIPDAERRLGLSAAALDTTAPPAARLRALDDAGVRLLVDCGDSARFEAVRRAVEGRIVERERAGALVLYELVPP